MHKNQDHKPSEQKFGYAMATVCSLLAGYFWIRNSTIVMISLVMIALALVAVTLIQPKALAPINSAWYQLGLQLGRIFNPLILGAMFFLIISPIALLMRATGRDLLQIRKKGTATYWRSRTGKSDYPIDFKRQY